MKDKKKILNKIKGKKLKSINYNLDETIISEDPFDIFYNSPITCKNLQDNDFKHETEFKSEIESCPDDTEIKSAESFRDFDTEITDYSVESNGNKENIPENESNVSKNKVNRTNDEDFFAALIKTKENTMNTQKLKPQIINQVKFYTSTIINLNSGSMYKYPHIIDIKFEEGNLFKSIYRLFLSSLAKIYNERQEFIVKYRNEVLIFEKDILKTTEGFKKVLDNNDIDYEINNELFIKGVNISLVVDFLLNEPLTSSYIIPLIISKQRFINGLYYEINIKKSRRAIKDNENILYEYILEGPFYNMDYCDYFNYKHKIT